MAFAGAVLSSCREGANVLLGRVAPVADGGLAEEAPLPAALNSASFLGMASDGLPLPLCLGSASVGEPRPINADLGMACPPLNNELLTDFTYVSSGDSSGINFSLGGSFQAGTFFYPEGPGALSSDVTANDWHLAGTVDAISGFGIYLSDCQMFNASSFQGISFDLWGEGDELRDIVFFVGSAANQVSNVWLDANESQAPGSRAEPNLGRCIPPLGQFDGYCREARVRVPVSRTKTTVVVRWQDLAGGCPEVAATPAEITAIAWYFPRSTVSPYLVDIHLDDLRFITGEVN